MHIEWCGFVGVIVIRETGYYRVGGLMRRVWLTKVYCYRRDRGYYRVGGNSMKGVAY